MQQYTNVVNRYMTVDEAHKINDLYKQIDTLTAENTTLKEHTHDHSDVLKRLDDLEIVLKDVACKCTAKVSSK